MHTENITNIVTLQLTQLKEKLNTHLKTLTIPFKYHFTAAFLEVYFNASKAYQKAKYQSICSG